MRTSRVGLLPWMLSLGLCHCLLGEGEESAQGTAAWSSPPDLAPHSFGIIYHVSGVLSLPYAEVREPFEAWVDLAGGRSRIQYYHGWRPGQVVTYQFSHERPFGVGYKVTPETTAAGENVRRCFRVNGTKAHPIRVQSVLPNLEGFQVVGHEHLGGQKCSVLQNETHWGLRRNVYTLWLAGGPPGLRLPVRYAVRGFSRLLGSHYDKYQLDYSNFSQHYSPEDVFSLPDRVPCGGVPSPEVKHHMQVNPMWDFVAREEDRAHRLFEHFRHRHGRRYGDAAELEHRRRNFLHNLRFIDSHNRANRPFRLAPNHLTDRTPGELAALRGRLRSSRPNHGQPFPHEQLANVALPESLDWRLYGAVTPVKDQAVCGSCWSFATTGTLEGALFLKTGELVPLSQQMLIDCSWDVGNFGCDGGLEWQAFDWIQGHGGLASADSYGPYEGQNGVCHSNTSTAAIRIVGYVNVPPANPTALKLALLRHGPVAVNVDASPRSFAFYANGIYYEPQCGHKLEQLNHAVLLVGYGVLQGQAFWLLKNSWSPLWGNSGYMLLAMKDNDCGVTTAATYPILE
ncbi:digestive cysteine proteinase 2-like isoform X2 [Ornithorhynchus anatinus]|uniref:digestive cysteine proteinase 2-like isoform X2 n=1 Tax=Ornithorhynchus anatinus TaxID=9258 RepID=UPI0010A81FCB|nr:digestive cysteine proteinase 2-like isoform X2 [Ornithorhynchus anatinus]